MNPIKTQAGEVRVMSRDAAFAELAQRITVTANKPGASIALSGGDTPRAFYKWVIGNNAISASAATGAHWFVSDERCVPLASDESNFGNAERQFLQPLGVPLEHRHPWRVDLPPAEAAVRFDAECAARASDGENVFDLCVLGMGGDAHTASFWPGCPLIENAGDGDAFAAATEWPARGWRLTVTPKGLAACGQIVVMAFGDGKAAALREVLFGEPSPLHFPAQVLRRFSEKVTWLVDAAAMGK